MTYDFKTIFNLMKKLITPIPSQYLYEQSEDDEDIGFYFGMTTSLDVSYDVAYRCSEPIVCIGGTGVGKSTSLVFNTLRTWKDPIFCIDIKGELSDYYKTIHESDPKARDYIIFDPLDVEGYRYDPFYFINTSGKNNLVHLMTELAYAIIPSNPQLSDTFWLNNERALLIGSLIYSYTIGTSFSQALNNILITNIDQLVYEIHESKNKDALKYINRFINSDPKVLGNIYTGLCTAIDTFASDPFIALALGSSDDNKSFTWSDLETKHIFLKLPESAIEQWSGVISLLMSQLFHYLERRPEAFSIEGVHRKQILLLLDEFARMNFKKNTILNGMSTLRSRKVTIAIFIQSLSQLREFYGDNATKIILDNAKYKVIFNSNDVDTQEYLSKLVGEEEVSKITRSISKSGQRSISINRDYQSIVRPYEFGSLDKIILIASGKPYFIKPYPYYIRDKFLKR